MAIELEDDHYQSHSNEPDPDCVQCRETWNYYAEAVRIIEGDSLLIASRKHLEAAIEKVQEREAVILALRELLEEALRPGPYPYITFQPFINRITNTLATTWPKGAGR